jgi:hypothetical protein
MVYGRWCPLYSATLSWFFIAAKPICRSPMSLGKLPRSSRAIQSSPRATVDLSESLFANRETCEIEYKTIAQFLMDLYSRVPQKMKCVSGRHCTDEYLQLLFLNWVSNCLRSTLAQIRREELADGSFGLCGKGSGSIVPRLAILRRSSKRIVTIHIWSYHHAIPF